ncbi:MAG: creatininase family protein [Pseudomonadota bacterium]
MQQRSVLWSDLRWPELKELATPETIVIVPVASIEQHGPHLPVITDTMLAREVAKCAAEIVIEKTPVLVTECIWTGLSEHHMKIGGTFTLDLTTFLAVIRGVVQSLHRQGFERVFLMNAHGGNIAALQTVVEELTREFGMRLVTATYWTLGARALGAHLERQKGIRHACEAETSMMMAIAPDLVDPGRFDEAACPDPRDEADVDMDGSYRWISFADKTPSGALGDPRVSSADKGRLLLDTAARSVAAKLLDPTFWPGDRQRAEV